MLDHRDFFSGGQWVPSASESRIAVHNPATEAIIATIPAGHPSDVDHAVASANRAAKAWANISVDLRLEKVARLRDRLAADGDELAALITRQMGCPIGFSRPAQIGLPLRTFDVTLAAMREMAEERTSRSVIRRDPVGVVAAITPWNFPLHQIVAKIVPALLAGCTVVLKPSEITPLDAIRFAQLVEQSGFPAGVFNLVLGGGDVGAALTAHPDVAMVSFTGSTATGRRIGRKAGEELKKVALELGGKSANVLLPDVDFDTVVPQAVGQCFVNAGQTCAALTRLIVPAERLDDVVAAASAALKTWQPGDPENPGTMLGPLASTVQQQRVQGFLDRAEAEGARLIRDEQAVAFSARPGAWMSPAIVVDAHPGMEIAREEVFGPVLTILSYADEMDAVQIANGTDYGLSGGVWSADLNRAERFANRLRTGQVILNGAMLDMEAPFGGVGLSGLGREYGRYGLEEFFSLKAITRPAA